jgi:hypothetical protein
MRYIVFFVLLFVSPVMAMEAQNDAARTHEQNVQEKIRQAPQMDNYCKSKLEYYKKKKAEYTAKLKKEENKGNTAMKIKLRYYSNQLEDWTDYCTKPRHETN